MYSIDLLAAIAHEHHAGMIQEVHTSRIIRSVRQQRSMTLQIEQLIAWVSRQVQQLINRLPQSRTEPQCCPNV